MSHLEDLICEYHEWSGYIVRRNVKVQRLDHGGWEGELDIVAYHPGTQDLVHLEPSIDAHSWAVREVRFKKKFESGRRYIFRDVFPWLPPTTPLRQIAVLVSCGPDRARLAGGDVVTIDGLVHKITSEVAATGRMASNAIPEKYPLLRTIQLVTSGYYRLVKIGS